jgi:glutathione synthase/RimK-type ligase-like ATP-grasp enzyme
MRCASDAQLEVHVLGTDGAATAGLVRSRYCAGLRTVPAGAWASGDAVRAVNDAARELGVRAVLATDPATTRFLVAHGDSIDAAKFPVLAPETFARLVNKDSFALTCAAIGLPHPATTVCATPDDALDMLDHLQGRAVMIKPVDSHAGQGVWKVEHVDRAVRLRVRNLACRPIVVQDFIAGDDVNALLFCKAGEITASIAYRLAPEDFTVVDDEALHALLARAANALALDGAIGFDLRIDPQGKAWFIECNPRFTYEGSLVSLLAGYNIVKEFLVGGTLAARAPAARMHRAKMLRPWSLLAPDRRHADYLLSDPRHSLGQACREFYRVKLRGASPGFGT